MGMVVDTTKIPAPRLNRCSEGSNGAAQQPFSD
jgi:hypothetical protein